MLAIRYHACSRGMVRFHFCAQETVTFKAVVNPDREVRSSGRVHNMALYRSARHDSWIRICFYILKKINLGGEKKVFSVLLFDWGKNNYHKQKRNAIIYFDVSHQFLSNLNITRLPYFLWYELGTPPKPNPFFHENKDQT